MEFRWPIRWRIRRQEIRGVKFSSDQVIFTSLSDFIDSVPYDLLNYCNPMHYQDAGWIGRDFRFPWEPIQAMHVPDEAALAKYFEPMKKVLISKIPPPIRKRRRSAWGDDGNEVDPGQLQAGRPFFRTLRRTMKTGLQSVALLVDLGIDRKVKSYNLYWRGATIVALADRLESAGYSVEIWGLARGGVHYTKKRDGIDPTALISIRLKAGGESLEVGSIVNVLSWMPRVIIYPLLQTAPCLRSTVAANESGTTRSWFWFDLWSLEWLNLPASAYMLYGFDSLGASVESMLAVLQDLEIRNEESHV